MSLSQQVIKAHEATSRTAVHVDNFLSRLQSIAKLTGVEIVTDLDDLRMLILSVTEDDEDMGYKLKSKWPSKTPDIFEGNNVFWSMFRESCIAFIKVLKRLHGNKVDEKYLMALLNSIEVKDKKTRK